MYRTAGRWLPCSLLVILCACSAPRDGESPGLARVIQAGVAQCPIGTVALPDFSCAIPIFTCKKDIDCLGHGHPCATAPLFCSSAGTCAMPPPSSFCGAGQPCVVSPADGGTGDDGGILVEAVGNGCADGLTCVDGVCCRESSCPGGSSCAPLGTCTGTSDEKCAGCGLSCLRGITGEGRPAVSPSCQEDFGSCVNARCAYATKADGEDCFQADSRCFGATAPTCQGGACRGSVCPMPGTFCSTPGPCRIGNFCDAAGNCGTPAPVGTPCGQGNPCVASACDGTGACVDTPLTDSQIACTPKGPLPAGDSAGSVPQCHRAECLEGQCVWQPQSGQECQQDEQCAIPYDSSGSGGGSATCENGRCVGPFDPSAFCDDFNPCTRDTIPCFGFQCDKCTESGCVGTPVVCNTPPMGSCWEPLGVCRENQEVFKNTVRVDTRRTSSLASTSSSHASVSEPMSYATPSPVTLSGLPRFAATAVVSRAAPLSDALRRPARRVKSLPPEDFICEYTLKPQGVACNDGDLCIINQRCNDCGQCLGDEKCTTAPPCFINDGCDPLTGNCLTSFDEKGSCEGALTCTNGRCDPVAGCVQDIDADFCVINNTCVLEGEEDPTSPCRVCNPLLSQTAYSPRPNNESCDDGNECTQSDTCQGGVCVGANPVLCTALDNCHDAGTCDPLTGVCSDPQKLNGASCSDGNACTQADSCQGGVCTGGNPVVCTAQDQCHDAGTCNAATGVCSNPNKANGASCSDGNACTQSDSCQGGACVGASPVVCAAQDQCHDVGTCNTATGVCSNPNKANGASCSDGNACTQSDSCQGGACVGASPVVCVAQSPCHDVGTCNTTTGACSSPTKANGASCSDGNACTQADSCQAGTCVGANPVVCTAQDQCHDVGTCNTTTGVCTNPSKVNGAACSDGNACTQADSCQGGACVGGSPVVCTAQDKCHDVGTCNTSTGACSNPTKANGASCSDGDACNGLEICQGGVCTDGTRIRCETPPPCRTQVGATCDATNGACVYPALGNGVSCSDGNVCNGNETCQSGVCSAGGALNCNDNNPCTADSCAPGSGCINTPLANGSACGDSRQCRTGQCIAVRPPQPPSYKITGTSCINCAATDGTPVTSWIALLLAIFILRVRRRRSR